MGVYLHEIVYTVPGQEVPYTSAIMGNLYHPILAGPGNAIEAVQLWVWRTTQVSNVWPRVILLWEIPTWAQLARNFAVQFTDRRDTLMENWWNRNLHLRRGGFDRLLISSAYSPDNAALTQRRVKGRVFLHEIVHVRYGEAGVYLDRLEQTFLPAATRHGWDLIGAYRVALRPREALVLWSLPGWDQLAGPLAAADEPDLREWRAYRADAVTCSEEMVLLPAGVNPLRLPG
jgi:hypothetical protein